MLTKEDHTRLRKIWHAALDLIIFGKPNDYEESHQRWMAAAPKIHETFAAFLDDHDPYLTPKTPIDLHLDRGTDRGSVGVNNKMRGGDGL